MNGRTGSRETAAAGGLLLLFVLVQFLPIFLRPSRMLYFFRSDFVTFLSSKLHFLVGGFLGEGVFPFWETVPFCGKPPLGVPQLGIFYPPFLLNLLVSPDLLVGYLFALHLLLSGLFLYLYAREIGLRPFAALFAACAFGFSGYHLARVYSGQYWNMASIAWTPAVFLFAERLLSRGDLRSALLLSLCLSLQFLAGHTQYALYTAYALAAYIGIGLIRSREWKRSLALLLLAALLSAGISAVQLFPSLEYSRHLYRANAGSLAYAGFFSLPWTHGVLLLLPDFFGNPTAFGYWGEWFYHEMVPYAGVLTLVFSLVALRRPRGRFRLFFAGLAILSLLFALGKNTPLFRLFYLYLPGVSLFRVPTRSLSLFTLSLSLLAGFGLGDLLSGKVRMKSAARLFLSAGLAATLLILLYGLLPGQAVRLGKAIVSWKFNLDPAGPHTRSLEAWRALVPLTYARIREGLGGARLPVLLLVPGLLFALRSRRLLSRGALCGCLLLLLLGDLWSWSLPMLRTRRPGQVFRETETIGYLKGLPPGSARILDLADEAPVHLAERRGVDKIDGFESMFLDYYLPVYAMARLEAAALTGDPRDVDYETAWFLRLAGKSLPAAAGKYPNRNAINLLNTRYVSSVSPIGDSSFRELFRSWKVVPGNLARGVRWDVRRFGLYENRDALPRAYLVPNARVVREGEDVLEALKACNLRETVVLEEEPGRPLFNPGGFLPARIMRSAPARVSVEVDAPHPGFLVLSDVWYPGWEAREGGPGGGPGGGRRLPLLRAFGALRCVPLDAGFHRVEFRYSPFSLRAGRTVSLAASLLALILMLVRRKRNNA